MNVWLLCEIMTHYGNLFALTACAGRIASCTFWLVGVRERQQTPHENTQHKYVCMYVVLVRIASFSRWLSAYTYLKYTTKHLYARYTHIECGCFALVHGCSQWAPANCHHTSLDHHTTLCTLHYTQQQRTTHIAHTRNSRHACARTLHTLGHSQRHTHNSSSSRRSSGTRTVRSIYILIRERIIIFYELQCSAAATQPVHNAVHVDATQLGP